MTHYVLIDHYSGYVWGEADAADPIAACQIVDRSIGGNARSYDKVSRSELQNGYHVHEAPADWVEVDDGQSEDEIARVSALPHVAYVQTETIAD